MLALAGTSASLREPKPMRTRILSTAARSARHARRTRLRFDQRHQWSSLLTASLDRLEHLRGNAHSFRDLEHYISRPLLHSGQLAERINAL